MANDRNKNSRWRRWGKRAGIVLLIIAGILLIIQILFAYFAESYLQQKIETAVTESAHNLQAEIGDLQLSTLKQQISINDIKIIADTNQALSVPFDSVIVGNITFNGFKVFSYLWTNSLALDYISIENPSIFAVKSPSKSASNDQDKGFNKKIYEGLQSYAKSAEIDNFLITGLLGTVRDSIAHNPFLSIHNGRFHFANIRLDSTWAERQSNLPSLNFNGSVDSLNWTLSSGMYDFRLIDLWFSSNDSSLSTGTIALVPRLPKYDFSAQIGHEIDRIDLNIGETELVNLDLPALIDKSALTASALRIRDTHIEVFRDKSPPAREVAEKVFPHVKLQEIKHPVAIDSILITNADITYSEHMNRVPEPGYISFENTYATIRNVYNTDTELEENSILAMDVNSEIMGKGKLKASYEFPVSGADTHTVAGRIDSMSVLTLNQPLKNLGKVEATSGQIHSIDFQMNLGQKQATGNVNMHYTDLKIEMIDFDDSGDQSSDKLKSMLANTFVIKENNKPPLREGKISHERMIDKSIFNYWWKSLLSGLKSSVGL